MNLLGHLFGLTSTLQDIPILEDQSRRWRRAGAATAESTAALAATLARFSHTTPDPSYRQQSDLLASLLSNPTPLLTPQEASAFGLFPSPLSPLVILLDRLCHAEGQFVTYSLLLAQSRAWRQAAAIRGRRLTALSNQLTTVSGVPAPGASLAQLQLEHLATL